MALANPYQDTGLRAVTYLVSVLRDLVRAPAEMNVVHVHPRGLPNIHEVLANVLRAVAISINVGSHKLLQIQ
jgi:hypothetical protein